MSPYRPKKRLGQNFLVKESIASKIVEAIEPQPGDPVVEIGAGTGALTKHLLKSGCHVTAIEFDRDLVPKLKASFKDETNLTIIAKDIMKITIEELPENAKLIGNLPYNISTAVVEKLYEFKSSLVMAVFMVQAEVAKRLTTSHGSRDYGSFTVIMKAGFDTTHLFNISPKAFRPEPEVNSSVIKLIPNKLNHDDLDSFKTFIRGCFRQKRKTLVNSMQIGLDIPKDICENLIDRTGHSIDVRAEQLNFDEFTELYGLWRAL